MWVASLRIPYPSLYTLTPRKWLRYHFYISYPILAIPMNRFRQTKEKRDELQCRRTGHWWGGWQVSVTMIGVPDQSDQQLVSTVRAQLTEWFGSSVKGWRYLRTYRIPHALPMQVPPVSDPASRPTQIRPGGLPLLAVLCFSCSVVKLSPRPIGMAIPWKQPLGLSLDSLS